MINIIIEYSTVKYFLFFQDTKRERNKGVLMVYLLAQPRTTLWTLDYGTSGSDGGGSSSGSASLRGYQGGHVDTVVQ